MSSSGMPSSGSPISPAPVHWTAPCLPSPRSPCTEPVPLAGTAPIALADRSSLRSAHMSSPALSGGSHRAHLTPAHRSSAPLRLLAAGDASRRCRRPFHRAVPSDNVGASLNSGVRGLSRLSSSIGRKTVDSEDTSCSAVAQGLGNQSSYNHILLGFILSWSTMADRCSFPCQHQCHPLPVPGKPSFGTRLGPAAPSSQSETRGRRGVPPL
ncbi:hypothetical protein DFJ74DRAFT_84504 [Hyaloraphidium curvatum]|nr:hypothetical protein DFJ74DRAFT_84504 [Hyaloraphidium curvatum]